jgi:hypothetical protein
MKLQNFDEFLNEQAKYTTNRSHSMFAMHSFSLRDQIHVWHWQTEVGDMHKALGDFYGSFLDQVDNIMEVVMGKYGRVSVKAVGAPSPLIDLADANVEEFLNKYVSIFSSFRNETFADSPELQNLLDGVIEAIEKLKYLLTMS